MSKQIQVKAGAVQQSARGVPGKKIKKTEFAGMGCIVQLLGLMILFLGLPVGVGGLIFSIPVGLVVLVMGGRMAKKMICSNCGNRIQEKTSRLCPSCGATFGK